MNYLALSQKSGKQHNNYSNKKIGLTCFKIEFKAKLFASFFVSVKIRVLLWAPQ